MRGTVQGVGFRPFVFRLAAAHGVTGWVRNAGDGVRIHIEGCEAGIGAFLRDLERHPPPAARIASIVVQPAEVSAPSGFEIRRSDQITLPATRISPDLPVCEACVRELFTPGNRRYLYAYITCAHCGPRFSIASGLPYDRVRTTMAGWPLCAACAAEYRDPADRRFHAQPIACPECGPEYALLMADDGDRGGADRDRRGHEAIGAAARLLIDGAIVAVKGIGGYHLMCDAEHDRTIELLRERKYRKEQPFALLVRDVKTAADTIVLTLEDRRLLESRSRPIVVGPARVVLPGVAPNTRELGVMLPYAPLHYLLFAAGAPRRLVATSGNRSSEPIAYEDDDARARLGGIADAVLLGERPIARRVDDSVVRCGPVGPIVVRRARGMAPDAVTTLPAGAPVLAVGGDLKNSITLVVDGEAYVSQHIGDLVHQSSRRAFDETLRDFCAMYDIPASHLTVVHDLHPEYVSSARAAALGARQVVAVQHHRAHLASALAERQALDEEIAGAAFDGTGYGDDGSIWGGEIFAGSVRRGFARVAHLHPAVVPGGDAAARHPVQAAAGFLAALDACGVRLPDMTAPPFCFPERYAHARLLVDRGVRVFATTSSGRLFDTVAALVGFTRPVSFEGQAAMWLEQQAWRAADAAFDLPMAWRDDEIDWRETLAAIVASRLRGIDPPAIARGFHRALARSVAAVLATQAARIHAKAVVLSGGVFQNQLLLADLHAALASRGLESWTNQQVPPNDGGLSLGQAAIASVLQGR